MAGKKTNKQRLADRIFNQLTVGELKKKLAEFPEDMIVTCLGHFGEVNTMHSSDFQSARGHISGTDDWRDQNKKEVTVLNINLPYIGDEPD